MNLFAALHSLFIVIIMHGLENGAGSAKGVTKQDVAPWSERHRQTRAAAGR